ncbi:MAG: hypothetical protein ACMV1B_09375 [Prevotella sp.]
MTQSELQIHFNQQYKHTTDRIHSLIAKDLGVKKLYTQSNLWCETINIDLRHTATILISSSTFSYSLNLKGHEMLKYRFGLEVNNAPNYKNITEGDIKSHSTDFRGKIETTNNLLKSIVAVKKEILQELEHYQNYNYQF